MRPQKFHLIDAQRRDNAKAAIDAAKAGHVVTISSPNRTTEQNALFHKWCSEIATQKGDESMLDVKAECNLTYGRPILVRDDPEWEAVFGYLFDALPHEKKLKAIRILDVPFTRRMGVKQLSEYMDQMQRDYREAGFFLSDPALMGYDEAQRV